MGSLLALLPQGKDPLQLIRIPSWQSIRKDLEPECGELMINLLLFLHLHHNHDLHHHHHHDDHCNHDHHPHPLLPHLHQLPLTVKLVGGLYEIPETITNVMTMTLKTMTLKTMMMFIIRLLKKTYIYTTINYQHHCYHKL